MRGSARRDAWRYVWGLTPTVLVLAGCGSGRSILEAGNEPVPTVSAVTTTTERIGPPETTPDGSVVPTTAPPPPSSTTPPTVPPTTVAPLDELPPCPTDALESAAQPVEITYWHGMNANNEAALTELVAQYHAGQDRVRVTLQNQGGYQEVFDKYYQSGADARPDLVMFPEWGFQQAIDSQSFVPAAACLEASGWDAASVLPQTLRAYAQAGIQWGMPFNVSNPLVYYNRQAFAAAGLPDRAPATFDELHQFARQLVDSGAAATGLAYDVNFDGGGGWYLEQWFANSGELLVNNFNGREQPATEVLFDGPAGQRLFAELQTLAQEGLLFNVGDNASGTDAFLKVADPNSPAAMVVGTSASLGTVVSVLGGGLIPGLGVDDIGVGPLPSFSGTPSAVVGGAANYIVASGSDAEIAATWDFVTFLLSPQAQADWATATGYVPIALGAPELEPLATVYREDPRFRVAYDTLVNSPIDAAHAGATIGPHRQVRVQMATALAEVLGGADVATALANAAAQSDALLQQYAALNQAPGG
jgi:sn-glycerol 3-phosphate transport system substrate-binding protein